jgi:alpha-D-xyloside xylohydrolase
VTTRRGVDVEKQPRMQVLRLLGFATLLDSKRTADSRIASRYTARRGVIPFGGNRRWFKSKKWSSSRAVAVTALLSLLVIGSPTRLAAQAQRFSDSSDYRAMLDELHHSPVHPSRMSAGTLLVTAQPQVALKIKETASILTLATSLWRLEVTKKYLTMRLTNKETNLTWQLGDPQNNLVGIAWEQGRDHPVAISLADVRHIDRHGDSWRLEVAVAGSTAIAVLEIEVISPSVVRLRISPPHLEGIGDMTWNIRGAGPFFGLGERFDQVNLDGLKTVLHPEDHLGQPGHNWTYIPVPFLFAPLGIGLYLDTTAVSTFDLTQAKNRSVAIRLRDASVDGYFFMGSPKDILASYTALTGRSPVLPPWAFGVWICSYQGPHKVLEEARRLRQDKIPASAIWTFDVMGQGDIMGWPLWWTGYYPNPRGFTDQLHSMGFKALTYIHPYLRSMLDPYNLPNRFFTDGVRNGLFVLNSQGEPTGPVYEPYPNANVDFTSPASVDWWQEKVLDIVVKDNFDGWMEDYGEWVKDTDRFAAGISGDKMANLYPLFYHKITNEIARNVKPNVVEFDRSGYAGSQGYTPVVWGGDQLPNWTDDRGLPSVVRAGITAGLSGFDIWGPDIEGNSYSKELWTRWVEFGALTPIMRNHIWNKPEGAVTLWYDQETINTFRNYAKLHISLFPYFYTYAQQATNSGIPIMRDLLLEFPNDPMTYDLSAEYMLGDKILVAPVIVQGAESRSLYLPQGTWVNYWSGEIMDGGRQVTVAAPLEQIPIMVRSGSILPQISPDTDTLVQGPAAIGYQTSSTSLIWRVFSATAPTRDSFSLYDGTTAQADQEPSEIEVRVEHSPTIRHYEVILPGTYVPRAVLVGGESIAEILGPNDQSERSGWRMAKDKQTLHVFLEAADFDLTIRR